ncbi:MAG: phosphatidylglycerol lysyltransferase domain-containing protein [Candidatus Omnitrophica bacterium]|nr:phosphatidylglycerol lysyltransferase domain-containing protein [Candidatus Omnitrophota bacterium]
MRLNKLSSKDKKLFDKYLGLERHELSVYAFANIYIWRKFFDIRWGLIKNRLCIFFKDNIGSFLYLPALGKSNSPYVINEVFDILDKENANSEFPHIENIEEKDLAFYRDLGFDCKLKSYDYVCRRADLAKLTGGKFKSKRASCNYFTKNYNYSYRKLKADDRGDCLKLYDCWMKQRKSGKEDSIYQGMLEDSRVSLIEAFDNYSGLAFQGQVVEIENKIKGFTFGFKLNPQTFCILYEITDLSVKGLAQFIFRVFAEALQDYKYINVMDDSGLENLKKVKMSYHPKELIPAYIVRKKRTGG